MIPEKVKPFIHLILPSYVSPESLKFEQEFLSSRDEDVRDIYTRMRAELNKIACERNGVCYPIIAKLGEDKFLDYGVREQYYYPLRESLNCLKRLKPKSLPGSFYEDVISMAKFPLQPTILKF